MKEQSQRIQELLLRYRENRCNRQEYEELIRLVQLSGNDVLIKEIMLKDWEGEQMGDWVEPQILPQAKRQKWLPGLKIAATIALLITAGFVIFQWFSPDPIAFGTGNGEVKEITLPDGSKVTLNANSQLTWVPVGKKEDRMVELAGEAFFHVAKQLMKGEEDLLHRGFQVMTPHMTVHVLGTTFNVSARRRNTEVFLQEGSVEVQLADKDEAEKMHRLGPGDKVIVDNKTGEVTERKSENVKSSASWVMGILNYHDKTLEEILQNLSELFGLEIRCDDTELKERKINLGVPYMDWENTKWALEKAIEVEFRKEGDRYKVILSK